MKKVRLLRDVRPFGRTGEIAEVSPAGFDYLTSLGLAVPVREAGEQAEVPETEPASAERAVKTPAKAAVKKPAAKTQQKKPVKKEKE